MKQFIRISLIVAATLSLGLTVPSYAAATQPAKGQPAAKKETTEEKESSATPAALSAIGNGRVIVAVHDDDLPACNDMDDLLKKVEPRLKGQATVVKIKAKEIAAFKQYLLDNKLHDDKYSITAPSYFYFDGRDLAHEEIGNSKIDSEQKFVEIFNKAYGIEEQAAPSAQPVAAPQQASLADKAPFNIRSFFNRLFFANNS